MSNVQAFVEKMEPYAAKASNKTGVPTGVVLAQWAHESGWGTSSLATRANNFAGIKYESHADFKSGAYSGYNSIDHFVTDYSRVMHLSYYNAVRSAGTVNGAISALGASPWAEDPKYGAEIKAVYNTLAPYLNKSAAGSGDLSSIIVGIEKDLSGKSGSELIKYAAIGMLAVMAVKTL